MLDPRTQALTTTTRTLIGYGHLTANTIDVVEDLGRRLERPVRCIVQWSHTTLVAPDGRVIAAVDIHPEDVNMARVNRVLHAIDELPTETVIEPRDLAALNDRLGEATVARTSPTWLFAAACISGACSLGLIFGVHGPTAYLLIACAAGLGGWLRRLLGAHGVPTAGQAFAAALVAGAVGGIGAHLGTTAAAQLVAVCPAMVLVPGPHLINGALDLTARHLDIGWHRLIYATMVLLAISGGLIVGLFATGSTLPTTAPGATVPFVADAIPAALAAASYSVYFWLPLRQIGWPVVVGGIAHAVRWLLMVQLDVGIVGADFATCLLVGLILGPVARRRHLSFSGVGFAAVVALIPGMYVFRSVAGMFALTTVPTSSTVLGVAHDVSTALFLLAAIALGLVVAHDVTRLTRQRK